MFVMNLLRSKTFFKKKVLHTGTMIVTCAGPTLVQAGHIFDHHPVAALLAQ